MLQKLERELERFRRADNRWDQSDHATNFVITAWHLADWIFKAIDATPLRRKLAQGRGVAESKFDEAEFYRWLTARCRSLEYCRVVGTISKHASIRRDDPLIDTAISLGARTMTVWPDEANPVVFERAKANWVFKAVDGDQRIEAIDAFQRILQFWTEFIHANKID